MLHSLNFLYKIMCGYSCAIIGVLKNDFDGIFVNLDMTTTERVINSRSKGFILRLPHVLISKPISLFSLRSVLDSFFLVPTIQPNMCIQQECLGRLSSVLASVTLFFFQTTNEPDTSMLFHLKNSVACVDQTFLCQAA